MMKKTLLITGGAGFLGKRLGLALKEKYDVILASRNNKQNMYAQEYTGCKVIPMDVANIESVRDAFLSEIQLNIHGVATKFVDSAEKQPMECVDVNVVGYQNFEDFYDVCEYLIKKNQIYFSKIYHKCWFAVDTVKQICKLNNN